MKALDVMLGLAENSLWSNDRLHTACAALSHEDYAREGRTSFFPSIHRTLTHILLVDWFYVDALERGGRGRSVFDDADPFPRLTALTLAQRAVDSRCIAYLRSLAGDAALDERVDLVFRSGVAKERAGDVLLHLFQHQIHHRGQAHAMLAGTGVPPPQLDEFFLEADERFRADELEALGMRERER
jgi:uncharacterized damage-inducible protein DinB